MIFSAILLENHFIFLKKIQKLFFIPRFRLIEKSEMLTNV